MPLLDYTTKVPAAKTVAEVQAKLIEHGARAAMMEYDDQGRITALAFRIKTHQQGQVQRKYVDENHAYQVAWRIIKDWVEAQMSLLETEMVKMEQIFLPYIITRSGQTIYQVMAGKGFLLGPGQ